MANRTIREALFFARMADAARLKAFIERSCAFWNVPRVPAYKLHLVAEELFTNSVKHGHRGDCDSPVWVGVAHEADRLHLTFADHAPPFNPLAHAESVCVVQGAAEHKVGGLGVLLVSELACAAEYAYVFGRNRLRLTLLT